MSIVENNSSKINLLASSSFIGKAFKFDPKYNVVQISCLYSGGASGILTIFHSNDGITYNDYGDIVNVTVNDYYNEFSLKGAYFYVRWQNNTVNNYTSFNLLTKIKETNLTSGEVIVSGSVDANITNTSLAVTGSVLISNDILVVEPINSIDAPYDLVINGPTLWADTTPVSNPFFADLNGREGWYYDNLSNIANKSNIYWYANPTTGIYQENDMTFAQLSNMYCIITPDYVENGELTIPFMGVYSQPTGTNDFIPTFAHSRWVYQLNSTNLAKLRKGETILLYTGATRPTVHLNIPAYQLALVSQNGDALSSEIIGYMTVNTQGTTSKIGYLLQYTGYLNSAIGFNNEYIFKNSRERIIQNNQYSNSFSISNFPATQAISGSVSVSNLPATQPISGSVSVSNFPATQPISGSVSVSNSSIAVTGDFYPATQPISGSVSVSNSSIAVTGDFYPATQPISGSVSVSNLPATQPISGSVSVSNFPATQPISGSVSVSNAFTLDTTTQSTNTKLDTIHNDLDGLTFDGSSNLNVNVAAGSISVRSVNIKDSSGNNLNSTSNALHTSLRDSAGNGISTTTIGGDVGLDVNLINSSVDVHNKVFHNGNWINLVAANNGHLLVNSSTQDGAGTAIGSTSVEFVDGFRVGLNTYMLNGTQLSPLFVQPSDNYAGGGDTFKISIYDAVGASITSTKTLNETINSLDTYIQGGSVSITGTPSVSISGTPSVNATIIGTPSVSISGTPSVSISGTPSVSISGTPSVSISGTPSVNATIVGTPSVNATIVGTPTVGLSTSANTIKIDSSNNSIKLTDGTNTAKVAGTIANLNTSFGVVSDSVLYGLNTVSGDINPLTVNLNGNKNQLEVRDADAIVELGLIESKLFNTTNLQSNTALSTYQIMPKTKSFVLTGISGGTANNIMAGINSSIGLTEYNWGKINPRTHYLFCAGVRRDINYTYINSSGDEITATATGVLNTYVSLGSIVSVNEFSLSGTNTNFGATDDVRITVSNTGGNNKIVGSLTNNLYHQQGCFFTVPNNAIAMITSIDAILGTSNDFYQLNLWDVNGNRSVLGVYVMAVNSNSNYRAAGGGEYGCIGRIIKAGETIAFSVQGGSSVSRNIYANIRVFYF